MALTLGNLLLEARGILNDTVQTNGVYRYTDDDLITYFNDALLRARAIRPDIFLKMGLRNTVPQYAMSDDSATPFPLDPMFYPPFVAYVVGTAELREDTFSDDSRAVALSNRFVSQMLQVAA